MAQTTVKGRTRRRLILAAGTTDLSGGGGTGTDPVYTIGYGGIPAPFGVMGFGMDADDGVGAGTITTMSFGVTPFGAL